MDWLLSLLPAPLYYAVIAGFLLSCLQLFGPDLCSVLNCLCERSQRLDIVRRHQSIVGVAKDDSVSSESSRSLSADAFSFPTLPLQFDISAEEDARVFACLGKAQRWKFVRLEFESQTELGSLLLTKLNPSARSLARNNTCKIVKLESLHKISVEEFDNLVAESEDRPIAVSLHLSAQPDEKPLKLLAKTPQATSRWLQQLLEHLLSHRPSLQTVVRPVVTEQTLTERLKLVCQAEAASFSVDLLALLLREFGVLAKRADLKIYLQKTLGKQKLETYRETMDAAKEVLSLFDGSEIFKRYAAPASSGQLITVPEFHRRFVTGSQGQKQSLMQTCRQLRSLASVDTDLLDLLLISRRLFKEVLASKLYTMPLRADQLELKPPLSLPLTDYFISTSHNTYLMEDQLKGRSDCLAYEIALKKNCRCVELDIHNGPNNDPIITHGGTMTSRIRFEDVIKTIRQFAFVASEYPLILSFENHCGIEQQDRMAQILTTHLKDYLYVDEKSDQMERLPSPEELKMKIIIKNKKPQPEPGVASFSATSTVPAASVEYESEEESDADVPSPTSSPLGGRRSVADTSSSASATAATAGGVPGASSEDEVPGASIEESADPHASPAHQRCSADKSVSLGGPTAAVVAATATGAMGKKRKKLKVSTSLSDLVSICRPVKFKGQKYARENYRPVEMSSLVESKVEKKQWLKKDGEDANRMVLHTQYQLVRVYPSGLRTNSSNYNPINAWRLGCQLVALNYQTRCENMELNDGLFQLNGACGYVPKPAILTDPATKFNPFSPPASLARHLRLLIVGGLNLRQPEPSAQSLAATAAASAGAAAADRDRTDSVGAEDKAATNPYVKAILYGVPGDEKRDQTKKADQGFNPRWHYRCFEDNELVRVPELAHLRLEVKDKTSGKVIGQFTAPLTAFNRGYRRINLKDNKDVPTASELWIKIKLLHPA